MYGCWNGILFGTAYDRECYIGRSTSLLPIPAETYYIVRILMKLTNNNTQKTVSGLTTGRLRWTYVGDTLWGSDKQIDFDLVDDDAWHLYEINVGPSQYWQGDINNLRVYPFVDGWSGDQFAIKYIKITSIDAYACQNTQCEKYLYYSHPCPWTGDRGSCEAGIGKTTYTTISGVSDKLILNIDGYGEEKFDLGTNLNFTAVEMSKLIANKIASINIGGYNYSEVEYSENEKLKIYSGNVGNDSTVSISDNTCARELGFFDAAGNNISTTTTGVESADGFDYAASRMLTSLEINRITDGDTISISYTHDPDKYSVEAGRRDFNAIGTPTLISSLTDNTSSDYASFDNTDKTIIDLSHPVNNNGRLNSIYVYGKISTLSKVKILRPYRDGTLKVIYSLDLPLQSSSYIYTSVPLNYRLDCDVLVSKGDLIGVYNVDLYVGTSAKGLPDAIFHQVVGDPSVGDIIDSGKIHSFGITGFAIYAKGNRLQNNVILDIDFGDRINIEELNIYGKEESSSFEYNVAACLDTSWSVNLYGGTHRHTGTNILTALGWTKYHTNVAYGISCLDDCITTADNGQVGESYSVNSSTGLVTAGDNHSYFYVNGDAEWLYSYTCDGRHEYCYPNYCDTTDLFITDPISFTMYFPYNYTIPIHRSIIYFKEMDNFRKIELAYYRGTSYELGNATYDSTMQRVPSYTSIKLNGLIHLPDESELSPYLFNNPTNDDAIYASADGLSDLSNPEEFEAAMYSDWTILEHNFEAIDCQGFRIFTNKHHSTKIIEMELYSTIDTLASLSDNVNLIFSDYGDVWSTAQFVERSSSELSAFIGGAPRYMRLSFESSTSFILNEVECLVGDQVKLSDCGDTVLLNDAKSNAIGASTGVSLQNVYGAPFDLIVTIPVEVSNSEDLVFWNKLNSAEDVDDPQIGPGCRLYKSDDYYIGNDNFLCSINAPAYGLKNLVNDKKAYVNKYIYDEWYDEYGTLYSGVSIDFNNSDRKNIKYSMIDFSTFNTYRYYKIGFDNISSNFSLKDIIPYKNDDQLYIDKVSLSGTSDSGLVEYFIDSNGFNLPTSSGTTTDITTDDAVGIHLTPTDDVVNKIKLFHTAANLNQVSLYGSNDNTTYDLISSSGTITTSNSSWYEYFSIDLEKRHDLSIIRNYGNATNKLSLGITENIDFSNSDTDDVYAVSWANSTYNDARWVRIKLLCGDGSDRYLRKLGIYPNISTAYCVGSSPGYNCEWESLGTILSEYSNPVNIAYGATISGSSYILDYYPSNAIDGFNTKYDFSSCWGVSGTNNYIELDFGDTYKIDKVIAYNGYDTGDADFINTAYNFSVSTLASGSSFTTVFSVTGNDTHNRTHIFDPVYARRARFTITAYTANRIFYTNSDGDKESFVPAFLRELEVFTYIDEGYVDSETWPVVAIDLLESFNITGHDIVNLSTQTTESGTDWDNIDDYFRYSDSIYSDPQKVIFNRSGSVVYAYTTASATGDLADIATEYTFDDAVYFDVGGYSVSWKAYDPTTENEISLYFIGPDTVSVNATNLGDSAYIDQLSTVYIKTAGKYSIKAVQNESIENSWGASNISIYRSAGLGRWISITRDTATNYSFNGDSDDYGLDYLSQLKVYGDERYAPTEHSLWWQSILSTLSNDGYMVMAGAKSLKIEYPASSGIDTLQVMEADDFGEDLYFSPKDFLHFYLYVDDATYLDTTYGDITFGSLNETPTFYYLWTLSGINLVSGWNDIKLKFEDANETYPYTDVEEMYSRINTLLNFRTNNRNIRSFRMRYKGIGNAFTMYIDDLKIQRNRFEDTTKFGNGLCLTNTDYLEVPLSSLNLEYGSMEFYIKLYTSTNGTDIFGDMLSRVLFTFINNNNDMISLGIKSGFWFSLHSGNARTSLNTFEVTLNDIPSRYMYDRGEVVHIGVSWSNDGTHMDNDDTIRLYLNGEAVCSGKTTWEVGDTKFAMLRFGGPNTQITYNSDISGSAIFSNIKVYNYCKNAFNINDEGISNDIVYTPNNFLEISSDDISFYSVGSENLPITFSGVPNGDSRTIYIRSNKDKNFSGSDSTANLLISWLTTV